MSRSHDWQNWTEEGDICTLAYDIGVVNAASSHRCIHVFQFCRLEWLPLRSPSSGTSSKHRASSARGTTPTQLVVGCRAKSIFQNSKLTLRSRALAKATHVPRVTFTRMSIHTADARRHPASTFSGTPLPSVHLTALLGVQFSRKYFSTSRFPSVHEVWGVSISHAEGAHLRCHPFP